MIVITGKRRELQGALEENGLKCIGTGCFILTLDKLQAFRSKLLQNL